MSRTFEVKPGPHSFPGHIQLAIQAHDLTLEECQLVRGIVTDNYMPSVSYKLSRAAGCFLQGYEEPRDGAADGWILVEFWCGKRELIDAFVDHLNRCFREPLESLVSRPS